MKDAFTVISISMDPNSKEIIVESNFSINDDSITHDTVKVQKVVVNKKTGVEIRKTDINYTCRVESRNIIITLAEEPTVGTKYYVYVSDIYDRLGRQLFYAYDRYVELITENIPTIATIITPVAQSAYKTKDINICVAISGKNDMAFFDDVENEVPKEFMEKPPCSFPDKDALEQKEVIEPIREDCVLQISSTNDFDAKDTLEIRITKDKKATSSNSVIATIVTSDIIDNVVNLRVLLEKDGQYYMRARIEESDAMHSKWSDVVDTIIKTEDLLTTNTTYLDELLFTDEIFKPEYEELKILEKSEYGHTDDEFYIEVNKPVKLTGNELKSLDDLVYIGKCYIVRRDL